MWGAGVAEMCSTRDLLGSQNRGWVTWSTQCFLEVRADIYNSQTSGEPRYPLPPDGSSQAEGSLPFSGAVPPSPHHPCSSLTQRLG